jgi:hypothetical protein
VKKIYSAVKEDEYEHIKRVINKIRKDSASGEYFLHNNCTEFPYHARIIVLFDYDLHYLSLALLVGQTGLLAKVKMSIYFFFFKRLCLLVHRND